MFVALSSSLMLSLSVLSPIPIAQEMSQAEFAADLANCYSIAQEAKIEDIKDETFIINDYAGNHFYIKTGEDKGFMVYDPVSDQFMEKSSELVSPYDFSCNADYLYFGPMNYFEKIGDSYYSIYDDTYVSEDYIQELQHIFDEQLVAFRNYDTSQDENTSSDEPDEPKNFYIENYEFIKNGVYPENNNGSCGFVAASIVLDYWEKTMYKGTVLPQYLDKNGNLNDTKEYDPDTNLRDKLVEFNDGTRDSWAKPVRDALLKYAEYANLSCIAGYYFFDINMKSEIRQNHPVIVFGKLPHAHTGEIIKHAVTAYGLDTNNNPIVNYGWGDEASSEVVLADGMIGSVTTFHLKEYEETVTVEPSDYGFGTYYSTSEVTRNHYKDGMSFTTKRLRTGYIENEYVVLSPRKEGYGTAYIEYNFTQPVSSIDVDLAFWSKDERYYSYDNPKAELSYQKLYDGSWSSVCDLLKINLPTNRTNPTRYTFAFPGKTKSIRFQTSFEKMSGLTDRNKGRICIGNMNVHTYF